MSRNRARALWCESKPIEGSPAETYLRECRGYAGELQPTLAYLPPLHGYPTATIAAFGMPREVAEGVLAIDPADVVGVHLTLLKIDGLGKAATGNDKLTLGKGHDAPIILAPPTDMMSLVIAEGIEDALSAHQALGCGAWAAGSVSRLPAMADHVPEFIESVVILVDVDRDGTGEKYSAQLAERLSNRGIETRLLMGPPDGCE
jgi:hypothetical protein